MILWIIGLIVAVPLFGILVGMAISAPKYQGPVSDHFDGKRFFNPSGHTAKGFGDVMKWQSSKRERRPWFPVENFTPGEKPTPSVSDDALKVTFVGHSTVLLQFDGLNVLTDPVWYARCSPVQFAGPKRVVPAGIRFEDLPTIHVVLQSHNHWDHLDIGTLTKLYKRDQPTVYTSLGVSQFLKKHGIVKAIDMDWEDSIQHRYANDTKTLTIHCLPAQHFSGRGTLDRNATLWSSFMLSSPTLGNVYFAGDSGYATFFERIGEAFGSIRLALIPIGAFKPEWFMSPIHCSPSEAVQIHLDLRAHKSLAIHHSTFPLADDGQTEPLELLEEAKILRGVASDDFFVLKEGTARVV